MRNKKLKRRLIKCLGLGALLTFVMLLAMPVWFGWILRPVLEKFDTQYTRYESLSYDRFALSGVRFDLPAAGFKADRIELHTPAGWLWRLYFSAQDDIRPYLSVHGWHLEFKDQPKTAEPPFVPLPVHYQKLDSVFKQIDKWAPSFAIHEGTVVFGDQEIAITKLAFNDFKLSLEMGSPEFAREGTLILNLQDPSMMNLSVTVPALSLSTSATIAGSQFQVSVIGKTEFKGNQIDWSADFGSDSFIPIRAALDSETFRVPDDWLSTSELVGATGGFSAVWNDNELNLNLNVDVIAPDSAGTVRDTVEFNIQATHTENLVVFNQLVLKTDWLHIEGSPPLRYNYSETQLTDPAAIRINANLGGQTWINASGKVTGEVQLRPQDAKIPDIALRLISESLSFEGVQSGITELQSNLSWPILEISKAEIGFAGDGIANLTATVNLADRFVTKGQLKIHSLEAPEPVSENVSYQRADLSGTFEGPFERLTHSGELKMHHLILPSLNPIDIKTEWSAALLDFQRLNVDLTSDESKIDFSTSIVRSNQTTVCSILDLNFTQDHLSVLKLSNPAEIRWSPKDAKISGGSTWTLTANPIVLQGEEASLAVDAVADFPHSGRFSIKVNDFDVSLLEGFVSTPPPNISIDDLNLFGGWTNSPLEFLFETTLSVPINKEFNFSAHLKADGNSNGIRIGKAIVSNDAGTILEGMGNFPLTIHPSTPQQMHKVESDQPLNFRITTTTNESFWEDIEKLSNLSFTNPEIDLNISGSISEPRVQLAATTEAISLNSEEAGSEIPPVENLRGQIELDRHRIRLNEFSFELQGQPVTANAEAPVNLESKVPADFLDWRKVHGRIKIEDAELSQIASAFPTQLSPQGKLNLELEILPNLQWNGTMHIDNAATRPIPSLGSIQEIHADIRFQKRQVLLESMDGSIGGSRMNISGVMDFAEEKRRNGFPLVNLKIQSENTPLVRQPDLMLRTDLDLAISNATNATPVVSGLVRLRDSFFLSDVKALQPGSVSTPDRRPPYFSITSPMLENWRLQLKVEGNEFLRIQTPLFSGRASTQLTLESTLKEPIALGDVTLNSGTIQFPFANLQITQGFISLTSENPYQPQLLITARSPVFGYDVTMSVRGAANEPTIELSSNPSLNSEQIMLMMTVGELPGREITFTNQQKATRMGMFLGKGLLSKFGSGSGGADRLTIRSGEYVSSEGKQTYSVEYKLTDRWSLVGEYDRFSQFNADLKWTFYSK